MLAYSPAAQAKPSPAGRFNPAGTGQHGVSLSTSELKTLLNALSERDPEAELDADIDASLRLFMSNVGALLQPLSRGKTCVQIKLEAGSLPCACGKPCVFRFP